MNPNNNEHIKLVKQVIQAAYNRLGRSFTRRTFRSVVIPLFRKAGRNDLNFGSWVSTNSDRVLSVQKNPDDSALDILNITARGFELAGIDVREVAAKETQELDDWFLNETAGFENVSMFISRKMSDPRCD